MAKKDFYTVKMASEETTFSERYLRDMIGMGKLKATKTGTVWFIKHEDLIEFVFSGDNTKPKKEKQATLTEG